MSNEKAAPIPQERINELIAQMSNSDDFCFEGDFQDCAKALNQQDQCIAALTAEVATLKAEIARRDAPVSKEEVESHASYGENGWVFTDDNVDSLILARATPPNQKGE